MHPYTSGRQILNVVRMVDTLVTADGIAALVQGNDPRGDQQDDRSENKDIDYAYDWVNVDRFRVKLSNRKNRQPGPSFLFERRGVANWKLIKLELPEAASKND